MLLASLLAMPLGVAQAQDQQAAASPWDLWRRAVEIDRANADWYPRRAAVVSEVRGGRRKVISLTEMFFSLGPGEEGWLRIRLDRSLRNGVDTTEKTRSKARIGEALNGIALVDETENSVSLFDSPFDPGEQGAVSFAPREEWRILAGRSCRRFDFTYRAEVAEDGGTRDVAWDGQAWIEEGSGRPVQLEFSIHPLPRKFRSVRIVYEYETDRPDRWVLKSVNISGHGGFLFIKRYFDITTTFSEFQRAPKTAPAF
jgi:hypothetical protein